jgi:PadR family transcriptional regulator, regulatory protein AphA
MSNLTPTAKAILGFLRFRARSGYDIRRAVEISTQFFWGASFGQIYPELKRLEEAGLVEVEASAETGRKRRVYRLTGAGEQAFSDWLAEDEEALFQYRDEGLLRMFFSDFAPPEVALENVRRMRGWREGAISYFHEQIEPHSQEDVELGYLWPYRSLQFGLAWLEAQATWLAQLEQALEDELKRR